MTMTMTTQRRRRACVAERCRHSLPCSRVRAQRASAADKARRGGPGARPPGFVDLDVVYNCTLQVASPRGAEPLRISARQRPTLLLPARGGGQPACPVLFTGASTDTTQYVSSFTMEQGVDCGGGAGTLEGGAVVTR